jgi:predicted nucleic acid-binding protein
VIHLDTCFLIRALTSGSPEDSKLRAWLATEGVRIATPAWCEFVCGPLSDDHVKLARAFLDVPLPFDVTLAEESAALINVAGRRRGILVDCMIAATALRAGARLATTNPDDFAPFQDRGLTLV